MGIFSERPDPHSVGEERCGGDELDRWRQSSRCFPLVGIASSNLPHITRTSIKTKTPFHANLLPSPFVWVSDSKYYKLSFIISTLSNPALFGPFITRGGGEGGRSVPKLSPQLLEGVTCSKKGLKLSSSNIYIKKGVFFLD